MLTLTPINQTLAMSSEWTQVTSNSNINKECQRISRIVNSLNILLRTSLLTDQFKLKEVWVKIWEHFRHRTMALLINHNKTWKLIAKDSGT